MNPLQSFLLVWYEHDPGACRVPLAKLMRAYNNLLSGDEHPRWRDKSYVADVLARSFPLVEFDGQMMVGNLAEKRTAGPPPYMNLLEALEVAA